MAITNVTSIINNHTTLTFIVHNRQHNSDTAGPSSKMPSNGGVFIHDMWVPWCDNPQDFDHGAFFTLTSVPPGITFTIWQQNCEFSDGDHVRFSTDGAFHECGNPAAPPVPGASVAGGDRKIEISGTTPTAAVIKFIKLF